MWIARPGPYNYPRRTVRSGSGMGLLVGRGDRACRARQLPVPDGPVGLWDRVARRLHGIAPAGPGSYPRQ